MIEGGEADADGGAAWFAPSEKDAVFREVLGALTESTVQMPSVWKHGGAVYFTSSEGEGMNLYRTSDGTAAEQVLEDVGSVESCVWGLYFSRDWVRDGTGRENRCVIYRRPSDEGKDAELYSGVFPVDILYVGGGFLYFEVYERAEEDFPVTVLYAMELGTGDIKRVAPAHAFLLWRGDGNRLHFVAVYLRDSDDPDAEEGEDVYLAYVYDPESDALEECTSIEGLARLFPATVRDGWLYYYDGRKGAVCRISVDGARLQEVLRMERVERFAIYGSDMILAATREEDGFSPPADVYVFSLESKRVTKLLSGVYVDTASILDSRLYYDEKDWGALKMSISVGGGGVQEIRRSEEDDG
jgi:hypothetical protein